MKRIPLAKLRYNASSIVAQLPGLKYIIRVETARLVKWYHVMPANEKREDAMCLLIQQAPKWELIPNIEVRIISEETARTA